MAEQLSSLVEQMTIKAPETPAPPGGRSDIEEFKKARETFKRKISIKSTDAIQTEYKKKLEEYRSKDYVNFPPRLTNKEKFKTLQQHRRLSQGDTVLRVHLTIGSPGSPVEIEMKPSELIGSNGEKQVFAHIKGVNPITEFYEVIKVLESYISENGGDQKRKEIAQAMLDAIYKTTEEQPSFKDVFKTGPEEVIQAAQTFILITQINVAVPMLPPMKSRFAGRTSGIDIYYRALLKLIVKSDGQYTFTDLQKIGFATIKEGAKKARNMAGTASDEECFEYVKNDFEHFKQAVEEMSDAECEEMSNAE